MRFVLFSMRNFERDGGGSIRMYGILNALAENPNNHVTFVSNAKNYSKFHPSIQHIPIGFEFAGKRLLQGLLSFVPAKMVFLLYRNLFETVMKALSKADLTADKIIFCEYLDNSIGYVLKKTGKIPSYINDLHGIAGIEFDYQRKNSKTAKERIINAAKYKLSYLLDKKVFEFGDGFLYASKAMQEYYGKLYPKTRTIKSYLLPYLLDDNAIFLTVDEKLKSELNEKHGLSNKDKLVFFAGGFKPTAGVEDLVTAFSKVQKNHRHLKLMIIGTGPTHDDVLQLISKYGIEKQVVMIDKIPYEQLRTYQSLANIIVCPDRQNPYSELILHLKYLDSLLSGRVVINGSFKSVQEINAEQKLSINFTPSDSVDLADKLLYCLENYDALEKKYQANTEYCLNHLTYISHINVLMR